MNTVFLSAFIGANKDRGMNVCWLTFWGKLLGIRSDPTLAMGSLVSTFVCVRVCVVI